MRAIDGALAVLAGLAVSPEVVKVLDPLGQQPLVRLPQRGPARAVALARPGEEEGVGIGAVLRQDDRRRRMRLRRVFTNGSTRCSTSAAVMFGRQSST